MQNPMNRQAWLAFLNEVLQEDLTSYSTDYALNNLVYWDSMARLVIFARLSETPTIRSAEEFRRLNSVGDLIQLIHE
jgi:acyl carrier protein